MFRALPAMLFDAPGNRLLLPCQASLPSCPQGPTGYDLDAQNAKQGGQWPQVILGWTANERRATADSRTDNILGFAEGIGCLQPRPEPYIFRQASRASTRASNSGAKVSPFSTRTGPSPTPETVRCLS